MKLFSIAFALCGVLLANAQQEDTTNPDANRPRPPRQPQTVRYEFDIRNPELKPDGFPRRTVAVNGQFPGTLIQAVKGDHVHIGVNNRLDNPTMRRSTSIHWHGLFQERNAYQDGPAFVTQCPIAPGRSYLYRMNNLNQPGTYWYHSHLSSQYLDGLRGPMVIYDPEDPHKHRYDVDDASTVIFLGDWFHDPAPLVEERYLSTNNTAGNEAVPECGTFNGVGRYTTGPQTPWPVMNFIPGKRYRLRIINGSAIGRFRFSIENHNVTVIESDGVSTQPAVVDHLDIHAGQRYSVVFTANKDTNNYWIRAPMTVRTSNLNPLYNGDLFAIARYRGAPAAEPTTPPGTSTGVLLTEDMIPPLENPGAPGPPQIADPSMKVFNLTFTRATDEANGNRFFVNGVSYHPPSLPTLLRILSGADSNDDFAQNENTFVINRGDVVEMNIFGPPGHPFHLHGHAFDVVKSASSDVVNFNSPARRDVTPSGGANGQPMTIRFKADNPGPWIMHCHIDMHLEAGLAIVFAEAPSEQRNGPQSIDPSPDWDELCGIYNNLPKELQ